MKSEGTNFRSTGAEMRRRETAVGTEGPSSGWGPEGGELPRPAEWFELQRRLGQHDATMDLSIKGRRPKPLMA